MTGSSFVFEILLSLRIPLNSCFWPFPLLVHISSGLLRIKSQKWTRWNLKLLLQKCILLLQMLFISFRHAKEKNFKIFKICTSHFNIVCLLHFCKLFSVTTCIKIIMCLYCIFLNFFMLQFSPKAFSQQVWASELSFCSAGSSACSSYCLCCFPNVGCDCSWSCSCAC